MTCRSRDRRRAAAVRAPLTALGGRILRDVLIGALPPATFSDWRYLAVAAAGALIGFFLSVPLHRYALAIDAADAAGLSLFASRAPASP